MIVPAQKTVREVKSNFVTHINPGKVQGLRCQVYGKAKTSCRGRSATGPPSCRAEAFVKAEALLTSIALAADVGEGGFRKAV